MTFISKTWDNFITALLKPFVRVRDNRLKLIHTIESDRQAATQRHIETILENQTVLVREMNKSMETTTAVLTEWLEGFHKFNNMAVSKPPVNDDERQWRLEMQEIARQHGMKLTENMSPYEIEAIVRQGIDGL